MEKKIVAAFDFDGTITYGDTLLWFLLYAGGFWRWSWNLILLLPWMAAFLLGKRSRQEVKEKALALFFQGKPLTEITQIGKDYAARRLPRYVRKEARARIRWHKSQGHECVIISASPEIFVAPWGKSVNVDIVLASKLESDANGCFTGKLLGKNCRGAEKVRRLEEALGPKSGYELYAYGDTKGDYELLAIADHPYYRSMKKEMRQKPC